MSEPSRVTRVTFFEDRAEVARSARVTVPAGVSWVALSGVTVLCDDPTVVAATAPGAPARVIASRVRRRMRDEAAADAAGIAAAEADRDGARARRVAAERSLARATAELTRCNVLGDHWIRSIYHVPRGGADAVASWRAAYRELDGAVERAAADEAASTAELEAARHDEARAELRASQARIVKPRFEAEVEVQIEAEAAGPVEVLLTYRTPCALWRPEHLARLTGAELQLKTFATAWQHTGEDWTGVPCRFSTARPAASAQPPLLSDDVLTSRRKSAEERKTVVVEAREQTIQLAGLDRGARAVDEMPGVDDGGEPLWFESRGPVSVPSTGQPTRLELLDTTLPCQVELVAFPERSEAVHLRATATLTRPLPLLAGPVRLARAASLVGSGKTSFVASGEPFELGFGVDDGVRVRRRASDERDTTTLMGTQKLTRTVRLYLSNLGAEPKRVLVIERVPRSEIEDVEIKLLGPGDGDKDARLERPTRFDDEDGFARFEVNLAPGATRELRFAYQLKAAAKVQLGAL